MAGNSRRRGAVRKDGSKKAASTGTGGKNRKSLAGKGPTPKAAERAGHPAARAAAAKEQQAARRDSARRKAEAGAAASEVVAGRNPVVEALRSDVPATALLVARGIEPDDRVQEALAAAAARGLQVFELTRPELDRTCQGVSHQGLALQVPPFSYASPGDLLARAAARGEPALLVALDGITDPRNVGAVVRSAAAFGAHGVILPQRRSATMTAAAWKTSAGAAARMPVARVVNLSRTVRDLQADGLFAVGLDAGSQQALGEVAVVTEPMVLVVGAEGSGLSRVVRQACDVVAAVPLAGGMESLNASVAAGIALYTIAQARASER
jgi:23S rRNA (guanosine2251-2'-O)-methyltransferase